MQISPNLMSLIFEKIGGFCKWHMSFSFAMFRLCTLTFEHIRSNAFLEFGCNSVSNHISQF